MTENDLSDNQRRHICRVLFVLLCALPTVATVYFATHRRTPDQWAQLVQAELGVETSIGAVETPRPGEFVFQDVRLLDDQGVPIVESLKVDVSTGASNRIRFRNRIPVSRAGLTHLLREATERLTKPGSGLRAWHVVFENVEIVDELASGPGSPYIYSDDIRVELDNSLDGPRVILRADPWGELKLVRDAANGEFQITIDTTTNEGAFPCWLAKDWFPGLNQLGKSARFSGVARIHSLGGTSNCALTGNFYQLDLSRLPHLEQRISSSVKKIHVSELKLEGPNWTGGQASMWLNDRWVDLPNPNSFVPSPQHNELFSTVIRFAVREVSDSRRYR